MTTRGAGKAKAVRRTGQAPGKLLFQGNAEQVPFILIGKKDVYAIPGFRSWFDGLTTNGICIFSVALNHAKAFADPNEGIHGAVDLGNGMRRADLRTDSRLLYAN